MRESSAFPYFIIWVKKTENSPILIKSMTLNDLNFNDSNSYGCLLMVPSTLSSSTTFLNAPENILLALHTIVYLSGCDSHNEPIKTDIF